MASVRALVLDPRATKVASLMVFVGLAVSIACGASSDDDSGFGGSSAANGGIGGNAGYAGGGLNDGGPLLDTGYTGDGQITSDTACVEMNLEAAAVPVDLYFMLDTSGSMAGENIIALRNGMTNFLTNPQSAGMGAAGQRFPIMKDYYNENCDAAEYAKPAVAWGVLPYQPLVTWVASLKADNVTPTIPALTGAVQACKTRVADQVGHKCAVVMVTDGKPEGDCVPVGAAAEAPLGEVAADAFSQGIPVFTIGFPGIEAIGEAVIKTIAARGGTGTPTIIQGGDVGQQFIDALNEIRGTAMGCEYQMPKAEAGTVDPDLVRVTYTPGNGSGAQDLKRHMDPSGCATADGWYYDDNAGPTKLVICPNTCKKLQEDENPKIAIVLGCTDNTR